MFSTIPNAGNKVYNFYKRKRVKQEKPIRVCQKRGTYMRFKAETYLKHAGRTDETRREVSNLSFFFSYDQNHPTDTP
uniref:Uncharacterized protein n=1 Tax=Pararge aegeria TaxID=116150 RepID=S4P119_9NEOP